MNLAPLIDNIFIFVYVLSLRISACRGGLDSRSCVTSRLPHVVQVLGKVARRDEFRADFGVALSKLDAAEQAKRDIANRR